MKEPCTSPVPDAPLPDTTHEVQLVAVPSGDHEAMPAVNAEFRASPMASRQAGSCPAIVAQVVKGATRQGLLGARILGVDPADDTHRHRCQDAERKTTPEQELSKRLIPAGCHAPSVRLPSRCG